MGWVSRKEYCEHEGIKIRTFQYRKKAGLIQWRYGASGRGGEAGKHIEVYINDEPKPCENASQGDDEHKSRTRIHPVPVRYGVNRGEPGCHVVTPVVNGMPVDTSNDVNLRVQNGDFVKLSGNTPQGAPGPGIPPVPALPELPGSGANLSNLPVLFKSATVPINPKLERKGYLIFALLKAIREEVLKNHRPKGRAVKEILEMYNSGFFLPEVFKEIGPRKKSTINNWDRAEKLGGVRALIPQYGGPSGSKITEYEKYILLNILLHQNRLKIGSAIKFTKAFLSYKKIESPSSEATFRRFIDEFKRTRYDAWVEAREGAKALNDKCLPYAERNWRLLTVGEGLVADGHRLNFQVINPFTGKKCRATIVLFWDWKSSYILGWEIMLEESIQCIASALRNGILTLGKIPKWLLIDNGKAFKANVFTSDIDLEDGITYGMFATLGIHTHFSQAYNPQEKPLERFWGTFNNWFERLLPSYTGASIPDKPPYMLRNEKDAQARHNEWVPKIEEVQEMLLKFREFYIDQPSRGRDWLTPREIFEAEKGPGVDPDELTYLMMAKEIKSVGRNGVTWNGWHYYDEALYGYRDKVICRYTHSDYSKIYLFSLKNQFLCLARPVEQVHPMASESEFPKDQEAVKQISSLKNRVRRGTKNLLNLLDSKAAGQIDWSRTKSGEISETIQKIEAEKNPKAVNTSPFVEGVSYSQDETPPPRYKPPREWSGYFEHWERYDYHQEQDPAMLIQDDLDFIDWYKTTSEYEAVYGPKKHTRLLAVK